jgi:hypothetical protein
LFRWGKIFHRRKKCSNVSLFPCNNLFVCILTQSVAKRGDELPQIPALISVKQWKFDGKLHLFHSKRNRSDDKSEDEGCESALRLASREEVTEAAVAAAGAGKRQERANKEKSQAEVRQHPAANSMAHKGNTYAQQPRPRSQQ